METKRRLRVLVVDEETEYFKQLVECAELCRHELDVEYQYASSREQANQLIRSWAPSAVVVDLHLCGDSGFDLIRGCTESSIPVVATSPQRSSTLERDALRQGASAYFAQSEDFEELETLLRTISQVAVREFSLH